MLDKIILIFKEKNLTISRDRNFVIIYLQLSIKNQAEFNAFIV